MHFDLTVHINIKIINMTEICIREKC